MDVTHIVRYIRDNVNIIITYLCFILAVIFSIVNFIFTFL